MAEQPMPANALTQDEAAAVMFALDDEDMMALLPREHSQRLHKLWRRLQLWRLATAGDEHAPDMLAREFPEFERIPSVRVSR